VKIEFFPLDVTVRHTGPRCEVLVFGKTVDGRIVCVSDHYQPNLLLVGSPQIWSEMDVLRGYRTENQSGILRGRHISCVRVFADNIKSLNELSLRLRSVPGVEEILENDLDIATEYMSEKGIIPFSYYSVEVEPGDLRLSVDAVFRAKGYTQISTEMLTTPKALAISMIADEADALQDSPLLLAAIAYEGIERRITWKQQLSAGAELVGSEMELIESLVKAIRDFSPDVLVGCNSDDIDLPLLNARAARYGIQWLPGRDGTAVKLTKGRYGASITGIVHADISRYLSGLGAADPQSTLPSKGDAAGVLKSFKAILPDMLELVKIIGIGLDSVCRSNALQLAEEYLISNARSFSEIIPRRPSSKEYEERRKPAVTLMSLCEPGLYEETAAVDVSHLITDAIVSANISPSSMSCECCQDAFCRQKKGMIPVLLEALGDRIQRLEKMLAEEDIYLKARHRQISRLYQSFSGYYGYPAARWYSMECQEAAIDLAKESLKGFISGIGGTQIFYESGTLYLTGAYADRIYTRGFFISDRPPKFALSRGEELISVGFKHRCRMVEDMYGRILRLLLLHGGKEAAISYCRDIIAELRRRALPAEMLAIRAEVRQDSPQENTASIVASKAGIKKGMISYIITRGDGPVADRARLLPADDYDSEYYLNTIFLPALEPIALALGYKKEDLLQPREQSKLGGWIS